MEFNPCNDSRFFKVSMRNIFRLVMDSIPFKVCTEPP
jgi:hypothetical protein